MTIDQILEDLGASLLSNDPEISRYVFDIGVAYRKNVNEVRMETPFPNLTFYGGQEKDSATPPWRVNQETFTAP